MLFSWIPIIGPIVDGLVQIFKQKTDTDVAKQVDANKTDVAVIQTRAAVVTAFKDDPGTRLSRDIIMFPTAAWVFCKVSFLLFDPVLPGVFWNPIAFPEEIKFMPYAVFAFLFATAWRK